MWNKVHKFKRKKKQNGGQKKSGKGKTEERSLEEI